VITLSGFHCTKIETRKDILKTKFLLTEGEEGADKEEGGKKKEVSKTSLKVMFFNFLSKVKGSPDFQLLSSLPNKTKCMLIIEPKKSKNIIYQVLVHDISKKHPKGCVKC
jgi:hypothetical protein